MTLRHNNENPLVATDLPTCDRPQVGRPHATTGVAPRF